MKKICFYGLAFFNLINAQTPGIMGIIIDRESQSPLSGVKSAEVCVNMWFGVNSVI